MPTENHPESVQTALIAENNGNHTTVLKRDAKDATSDNGTAPATPESFAELHARVSGMATWAAQTNSEIKGLVAAGQVFQNSLEQLNSRLDIIATKFAEIDSGVCAGSDVDPVIGYRPSPEQQAQLFGALAEWQLTARPLEKASVANIQTRGGSTVSYRYADIAAVSEIARSAGSAGLSHFHCQVAISGQQYIRTYLLHKAGGWISCDVPLMTRENTMISGLQQWASTCTMARRYGLFMVLGIAAGDEDDDGTQAPTTQRAAANIAPRTRNGAYNASTSLTPQ